MIEKEYPYLAKNTVGDKTYVVFFSAENYGTVVMSEITDNPDIALGAIGDFDENVFEVLDPEIQVSIHNFSLT